MKDKWLIYKIVFPNGKNYIGLTKDLYNRISCHKRDASNKIQRPVYNAINHFGWDNIEFHEIHTDIETLEEANELEQEYIQQYNSYIKNGKGYNCTEGGDGCSGNKKSAEEIEAFRQRSIEMWKDPDHRKKMKEYEEARKAGYTLEVRKKMSKLAKKRIARDGHAWEGRNHKESSKEKMRGPRDKNHKGYVMKSIKQGKRVLDTNLQFVFFSLKYCAEYYNVDKAVMSSRIRNTKSDKFKHLTYYNKGANNG